MQELVKPLRRSRPGALLLMMSTCLCLVYEHAALWPPAPRLFVASALTARASGTRGSACCRAKGGEADESAGDAAELIEEVKELQRNSMVGREQWTLYCRKYAEGEKDPERKDAEFLDGFLAHYKAGFHLHSLAGALRTCMEESPGLRCAWQEYMQDLPAEDVPNRRRGDLHEFRTKVLAQFLWSAGEHISAGTLDLGKRSGTRDLWLLRQKVKQLQRSGKSEEWCEFAGETVDPAVHPENVLREFVEKHGAGVFDPAKDQLVLKVFDFQRRGHSENQAWRKHVEACGWSGHDPFQRSISELEEFAAQHNL